MITELTARVNKIRYSTGQLQRRKCDHAADDERDHHPDHGAGQEVPMMGHRQIPHRVPADRPERRVRDRHLPGIAEQQVQRQRQRSRRSDT